MDQTKLLPPLTVEKIVNGGAGLAYHKGRVVFIPHTAVGDRVLCRIVKEKKHYLEAVLVELLEPGARRRVPPCPVAGSCGGCQWQHIDYREQCRWKEELFRDTLVRQCGVDREAVGSLVAAPNEWFYRSRVQVKCHDTAAGFITGFYRPKSRFVIAVDECRIIDPSLNRLLLRLRSLFDGSPFASRIPQIDLAIDDRLHCAATVHYLGDDRTGLVRLLSGACLDADLLIQTGTKSSLEVVQGRGVLRIQVGEPVSRLDYSVGSFAQINLEQNRRLVDNVVAAASLSHGDSVVDLYCGMGNFTIPLARSGAAVVGIEESAASIARAIDNARLNNVQCRFICGCAISEYRQLATRKRVDLLLLDPPRAGAFEVMKMVVENPPRRIIYVSCDPQTLARDLKPLLHSGYRLVSSQPFDLFPQTYHCESVTVLEFGQPVNIA